MKSKLTPRAQRFVDEYLIDLNGKQAAIRAGYSPKCAEVQASRLLSSAKVGEAVAEARAQLSERSGRSVAAVMADIGRVRADAMQEVVDLETGTRAMLSHKDALKALELEGKHLGAFTEKVEHTGPGGGPIPVAMSAAEFRAIAAEIAGKV